MCLSPPTPLRAADMCLGIPGRIVEVPEDRPKFARVDVQGVVRDIHLGLLADDPPGTGDWVVIHLGFALERMTEAEAMDALGFFEGEEPLRPWEESDRPREEASG